MTVAIVGKPSSGPATPRWWPNDPNLIIYPFYRVFTLFVFSETIYCEKDENTMQEIFYRKKVQLLKNAHFRKICCNLEMIIDIDIGFHYWACYKSWSSDTAISFYIFSLKTRLSVHLTWTNSKVNENLRDCLRICSVFGDVTGFLSIFSKPLGLTKTYVKEQ